MEARYRPKKNNTIIMTKPVDFSDSDNDDDVDTRPTKQQLPGLVVPWLATNRGTINTTY